MAKWKSFGEDLKAVLILLALVAGIAGGIWLLNIKPPPGNGSVCPYCGKIIQVKLEKNGEQK
jgi:hypothetical protein